MKGNVSEPLAKDLTASLALSRVTLLPGAICRYGIMMKAITRA